jgi:hypothetical protein
MVESRDDQKVKANVKFLKLNKSELSEKIALLVSKRGRVVFWKSIPRFYEGRAFHSKNDNKFILSLTDAVSTIKFSNEKVCLNFIYKDVEYFFRGLVIEHIEEENFIRIQLEEECFRLEKRSRDRVVVYPKFEAFAYFKYFIDGPKNVIQFNKSEQKSKDFLNKLNDDRLKKLIELSTDLNTLDEEDIVGFRIEDMTTNGLSFLANQNEKENILEKYKQLTFRFTINLDMQVFTLEEAKIAYIIDYINPDFIGLNMFKVGITFKHSPSLKRKLEDLFGVELIEVDFQKEFDEFVRNE